MATFNINDLVIFNNYWRNNARFNGFSPQNPLNYIWIINNIHQLHWVSDNTLYYEVIWENGWNNSYDENELELWQDDKNVYIGDVLYSNEYKREFFVKDITDEDNIILSSLDNPNPRKQWNTWIDNNYVLIINWNKFDTLTKMDKTINHLNKLLICDNRLNENISDNLLFRYNWQNWIKNKII